MERSKKPSVVFSDELLEQFFRFRENGNYDKKMVEKLLHYYKPIYLTNVAQLTRIGRTADKTLITNLLKSGYKNQSLEELAKKTGYKVVLCTDRSDFPFVNVDGDRLENNFSGTFLRKEERSKAVSHIKSLCEHASHVVVYDKYFCNYRDNVEMLKDLLPTHKLEIKFCKYSFSKDQISDLKSTRSNWTLNETKLPDNHDRYLIIDDKIEIVLTSGFRYLSNTDKDFTYLVREIDSHQFL